MKTIDPKKFAQNIIKLYGGRENFIKDTESRIKIFNKKWSQDLDLIGKVLRSHLVLEHYLIKYIEFLNPNINSLENTRISFAILIDLLKRDDYLINKLIPGMIKLNQIRNRIAHNLDKVIDESDAQEFLRIDIFREFRNALSVGKPLADPLDILEDFAKYSSTWLLNKTDPKSKLWSYALKEN